MSNFVFPPIGHCTKIGFVFGVIKNSVDQVHCYQIAVSLPNILTSLTPLRSTVLRYLRWGRRGGRRNLRRWMSRWCSSVSGKLHKLCSRDFSQYYRETQANRAVLCGYRVRRVDAGESHQLWVVIQTKVFFCHAYETHARHTQRVYSLQGIIICFLWWRVMPDTLPGFSLAQN